MGCIVFKTLKRGTIETYVVDIFGIGAIVCFGGGGVVDFLGLERGSWFGSGDVLEDVFSD